MNQSKKTEKQNNEVIGILTEHGGNMTEKVAGVLQDNLLDLANHEEKWPIFNFYLYQQPKKSSFICPKN